MWKAPVDKLCHLDEEAFASPKHKSRTHVHEEVEVMLFSTITNRVLEQLDLSYILEIEDQYEELESFLQQIGALCTAENVGDATLVNFDVFLSALKVHGY